MRKLRLLLFSACNRHCEGCCNQHFDLETLPVCTDYTGYDMVLITGGEPMLNPARIIEASMDIYKQNKKAKVILYTALVKSSELFRLIAREWVQGVTITLHEPSDLNSEFFRFLVTVREHEFAKVASLRLNVFPGVELPNISDLLEGWNIKQKRWRLGDEVVVPEDEVFMRYR